MWFAFTIWACSAYGGGCKTSLFSAVPDVDLDQSSALAALLQFGFKNAVCLAVEAPAIEALKNPVRIHLSHPTVAYVVQKLLGGGRYQLSESNGVILIRNVETMGQTTQLTRSFRNIRFLICQWYSPTSRWRCDYIGSPTLRFEDLAPASWETIRITV